MPKEPLKQTRSNGKRYQRHPSGRLDLVGGGIEDDPAQKSNRQPIETGLLDAILYQSLIVLVDGFDLRHSFGNFYGGFMV